ncbi:hypothetical protein WR25_04108 [Diploscapter pachys]|uniref:BZIP domain-containing protein n=1 Tax=Diploscapter pachys TaxID=2018661 RepID=A0A2A2J1K8_9BILA|nr:hypothetical protein WR25_04108 [Diploscapter pachys]
MITPSPFPILSPSPALPTYQVSNDIFISYGDFNSGPAATIENMHPEIEDNDLALKSLTPTIGGRSSSIAPADGNLVVRNDTQRANVDQQGQVVEDDQPMMPSNVVPAPAQVSPAANKSNCGGPRRVQKPTEEDSACEKVIKNCRVYKKERKQRTVYTNNDNGDNENAKKTGKRAVAKSGSESFRKRNNEEEKNLTELKKDKQKDLETELAALNIVVLSCKRIVDQFSSKIQHLYCTALDLSQHQLKIFTREEWDNICLNVDLIKERNLNQEMLNVEQLIGDDHVDQRGNNARELKEEVEKELALKESENPNRKTEEYWATISDEEELKKQKRREKNRIDGAKSRIREKLRKEMLRKDIKRIETKWDRVKKARKDVADMFLELRGKGIGFVDHAANWIKYLQDVQANIYYPSPAARENTDLDIAKTLELFEQTQGPYQA